MILYAGNILSSHGFTPTFIELLTPKLSEYYNIKSVSDKKEQSLRMWDMITTLLKNKNEIKLVLVDSYSLKAFWYTYAIAKICIHYKIPYIPILRGGSYPERLKRSPALCKIIFSNSVKNISPSLYLKKFFEDDGFEVEYIPNFIPVKDYKFKERAQVHAKLLWVRSFDKTYNPLLAIEILKNLKLKYSDATLCMVGPDKDETLQRVIDKANEYGLSNSLKLTGMLSKKDWTKLSEEYDIFINTTDFDNHPVSVIEGMALGLPVISTSVGGIPYLIDHGVNGILVPPKDADNFVEQIENLISHNELVKSITSVARKKVESFDWDVLKSKWFSVIDPFVKNKSECRS